MIRILNVFLLVILLSHSASADDCTFTDSGDNLNELLVCPSFVNADKAQIRFARIDSVDGNQVFVGPSRYLLDDDTEVFDPDLYTPVKGNCVSDEGSSAVENHIGEDVAFILEDVGPLDDRRIQYIWLLNCEITQGR